MPASRVAIKQLTASDLSFFAQHLKKSKQKAINLNSDVFVDVFYPGLRGRSDEFLFRLSIVGPGGDEPYLLTRKAVRTEGAKNWRLNGEIVHDPPGERGRFDPLQENDFAVLAFEGADQPQVVTLILVSARQEKALHAAVRKQLPLSGKQSMTIVSQEQLSEILEATRGAYGARHPLEGLLLPDTIEEALFGSAEVQRRIATTNGRGAAVSQDVMRQQLRAAEQTGYQGEAIFNQWLETTGHAEGDYEWVSRTHARATHDFDVKRPRWERARGRLFIDVKATRGAVDSPIHMSMAEIRWAATHANHRIARIHGLGSDAPMLTMLVGIRRLAKGILDAVVPKLPEGVAVDGFEIEVAQLGKEFTTKIEPGGD